MPISHNVGKDQIIGRIDRELHSDTHAESENKTWRKDLLAQAAQLRLRFPPLLDRKEASKSQ